VCINPTVFSFTDFTVSEILFLLLSLSALLIFDVSEQCTSRRGSITLLAVVVSLGCLTRSAAVPLAVAVVVHFAWAKRYRALTYYLCVVFLLISPWWLWIGSHAKQQVSSLLEYYVSYSSFPPAFVIMWSDPFGAIAICWGNLRYLIDALDLIFQSKIVPGLLLPVGLLLLLGLWRSFNHQSVFFRAYVVLYFGLIVALPFPPERYLIPLIPAMYFFLFRGVQAAKVHLNSIMSSAAGKKIASHLVQVMFALVVVLHVGWIANYMLNKGFGKRLPASWDGFSETFEWIRNNTDESAVLATVFDPMYYLYTGRRSIQPGLYKPATYYYPYGQAVPDVGSPDEIKAQFKSLGVGFLLIHPLSGHGEGDAYSKLWTELIRSYHDRLKLVFISSDAKHRIYSLPQD
jgi:hypothetical protein